MSEPKIDSKPQKQKSKRKPKRKPNINSDKKQVIEPEEESYEELPFLDGQEAPKLASN